MSKYSFNKNRFVRVLVTDELDRFLILQTPYPEGALWNFPGGKVERWETPREAAERELLEETGLIAEDIRYLGWKALDLRSRRWEGHFFVATVGTQTPQLKEPDKATAIRYVCLKELSKLPRVVALTTDIAETIILAEHLDR